MFSVMDSSEMYSWFGFPQFALNYQAELSRLFPDASPPVPVATPMGFNPVWYSIAPQAPTRQRSTNSCSWDSDSCLSESESSAPVSPSANSMDLSFFSSPWEEFENNGKEAELDEMDKLMRRLNLDRNVRSSSGKPMSGRAEELLNGDLNVQNSEDPMIVKNRLIQLLRQEERNKSRGKKSTKVCVFCRNNGESETIYSCHTLKDEQGHISCPILYCYTCPKCGATKDNAHTLKYCPLSTGECPPKALRSARTSAGRKRFP